MGLFKRTVQHVNFHSKSDKIPILINNLKFFKECFTLIPTIFYRPTAD